MKVMISQNQIIIQDYREINLISDEKIIVDASSITGYKLHITSVDDYTIIIRGLFEKVVLNENHQN